jgi:hypothetical protein
MVQRSVNCILTAGVKSTISKAKAQIKTDDALVRYLKKFSFARTSKDIGQKLL